MDIVSAGIHGLDAVLAQLALTLSEGQARVMLGGQRRMSHRVRGRIGLAAASGNSAARTFVESVAREHKDPAMREVAEATLLAWRPR